jgi:hypothetical protein
VYVASTEGEDVARHDSATPEASAGGAATASAERATAQPASAVLTRVSAPRPGIAAKSYAASRSSS